MHFLSKLLIGSTLLLTTGCSSLNDSVTFSKTATVKNGLNSQKVSSIYIDYAVLSNEITESIFKKSKVPNRIIVTDFVNITSLDNNSRLGYVLSNNVKNSIINTYNTNVIEAEVSKYFKISGNGLKILSRDVEKLRSSNFDVRYVVAGTYTYTSKELVVFVKLIDLKTGIIKGSYAKTLPMGEGTETMLHYK